MDAATRLLQVQLSAMAMVNKLALGLLAIVASFAVVEIAKPPIVYVGKIEQTFTPVEFPPAIWRGLKD